MFPTCALLWPLLCLGVAWESRAGVSIADESMHDTVEDGSAAQATAMQDGYLPLNTVVAQVQRQFKATAIRADAVQDNGELIYRIRLLSADKARVWTVDVDARTGRIR